MATRVSMRPPLMLIGALSRRSAGLLSALRYDLSWRFARPGSFRRRFEQAVTNMSQGVCLYDAQDRLQLVNEQFCRIYRQPITTLHVGMRFRDILAGSIATGNYPGRTTDEVWRVRKAFIDRRQPGTFLQELGDGRLIAISHQPLLDGGWVATYEDITERRQAEMQITFMAHHDSLTKLPNRLLFGQRLEKALAAALEGGSCALICLDLDGFKQVNDVLGHAAGDLLLCRVAERLQSGLRGDDIAARLGGDEFAVLLPDTEAAEAMGVARRISTDLRREYDLGAFGPARIGASVGIACAPDHAGEADTLLSHADRALYAAKRAGLAIPRLYDPRLQATALHPGEPSAAATGPGTPRDGFGALRAAASMVDDLRAAMRSGDLRIEYQPICDCITTEPVAYEALLRWTHPIRGIVPPSEFIPAAEESGFIVALGEWVLREACAEAARWDSGASVGVNLSPLNFSQPDLVATVSGILAETDFAPERLIIEITEGLLIDYSTAVQTGIQGLRALGVELWLDDFGSGYANFAALHALPFTSIKIDRSFLADGQHGTAILSAIVALGQACGLKIVAEGVETAEQHDLLRSLGCDRVQGYLFGRPSLPQHLPGMTRHQPIRGPALRS
jgi:diguanylate cyclase (GGDEF)-like protein